MESEAFQAVLAAAKLGQAWAWERIYGELSGPLLGYARARGATDPTDVVGEVFLHLARGAGTFDGGWSAFKGWAFLIASHRVVDDHRRRSRRPEALCAEVPERTWDGGVEVAEAAVAADTARALLRRLSPDQQEVLLLRVVGDLSIEEVARVTGRTSTGVKALQRRGLAALRRIVDAEVVSR